MFHRVLDPADPRWNSCDPDYTLPVDLFIHSLEFFRRHYNVVSMEDVLAARHGRKRLPPRPLLITFDDGWADNADFALPQLHERALPALMFVVADAVGARQPFYQERIFSAWRRGTLQMSTLREELLPETVGRVDGVEYAVTGTTALDKDWEAKMTKTAPLVFGFVLIFAFLILLASFRSIVVAIKAIVLNLLSVGAAYGILVATFQWGWGESLLDFKSNGGITPWLPMFLFVILFGLSMDYHVFILSRVREAYDCGLSNEDAVAHGIKSSAGVVTSAAVVMVVTFSVFAMLPLIDMKEMGIGLAAAVLLDATLIRGVLLPATMKLLGERNWYLPRWLEWLPRLEHAPAPKVAPAVPEAA